MLNQLDVLTALESSPSDIPSSLHEANLRMQIFNNKMEGLLSERHNFFEQCYAWRSSGNISNSKLNLISQINEKVSDVSEDCLKNIYSLYVLLLKAFKREDSFQFRINVKFCDCAFNYIELFDRLIGGVKHLNTTIPLADGLLNETLIGDFVGERFKISLGETFKIYPSYESFRKVDKALCFVFHEEREYSLENFEERLQELIRNHGYDQKILQEILDGHHQKLVLESAIKHKQFRLVEDILKKGITLEDNESLDFFKFAIFDRGQKIKIMQRLIENGFCHTGFFDGTKKSVSMESLFETPLSLAAFFHYRLDDGTDTDYDGEFMQIAKFLIRNGAKISLSGLTEPIVDVLNEATREMELLEIINTGRLVNVGIVYRGCSENILCFSSLLIE